MHNPEFRTAKEILDPIVDVFSGADIIAFAQLFHRHFPEFLKQAQNGNQKAYDIVKSFDTVSQICNLVQGKKPI